MAPARPLKRQKTNPTDEPFPKVATQDQTDQAATVPLPETPPPDTTTPAKQDEQTRYSWLARTWPRKAPPSTETNRETASSAVSIAPSVSTVTSDVAGSPPKERVKTQRSPSLAMTLGKSKSNRSLPIGATTTIVHAISEARPPPAKRKSASEPAAKKTDVTISTEQADSKQPSQKVENKQPEPESSVQASNENGPQTASQAQAPAGPQSMWMSWVPGRRDVSAQVPQPHPDVLQPKQPESQEAPRSVETATEPAGTQDDIIEPLKNATLNSNNKRSWYQMWGGASDAAGEPAKQTKSPSQPLVEEPVAPIKSATTTSTATKNAEAAVSNTPRAKEASQASSLETSPPPQPAGDGTKSGWVFWSREKKRPDCVKSESEPRVGEIAISDTSSQAKPKRASISLKDDTERPVLKPPAKTAQPSKGIEAEAASNNNTPTKKDPKKAAAQDVARTTKAESSGATATAKDPRPASPAPSVDKRKPAQKPEDTNLLLPFLHDSLPHDSHPSIIQQLARLLISYTKEPSQPQHLTLLKDPPRIRNALAIGVHGYFPGPLVQKLLGQPTGTSIKFAEKAAQNIRAYTKSQGYTCEVKTAALEGEGRIAERVELLWGLLLNWIDEIRRSDVVVIAAHSQGVPVAIMLVAKLIHFGCISPSAKVGICAMAGVNMGPFQDYKSPWITGSAGELFDFTDPNSRVSKDYLGAISDCLHFGVKITFVGSIDDQLVSMESSMFTPLTHPHIYRAVSIDSRIHAPNFLSNLVGFVLKLRNIGVPDHGLLRELSTPLAGSLYTGEGHSRLYEDDAVYLLSIAFTLETTALPNIKLSSSKRAPLATSPNDTHKRSTSSSTSLTANTTLSSNPYILPFAMRGILEEDVVKTQLRDEVKGLLEQFDQWEPKTKVLKDVKFRLEGVRGQLL